MRYLGTCDGNMQEGSLRADVNVSVRKEGEKNLIIILKLRKIIGK